MIQALAARALAASSLGARLSKEAGMEPMGRTVANVLFWLVILLFMPSILAAFDLRGLLEPVQGMLGKLLDMVPNVFGALVIGFVGWLVAKVLRGLVTTCSRPRASTRWAARSASRGGPAVAPRRTIVSSRLRADADRALDALKVEAISKPRRRCWSAARRVPNLVAAALIPSSPGRAIRRRLLSRLRPHGLDTVPEKLGMSNVFSGVFKPSR